MQPIQKAPSQQVLDKDLLVKALSQLLNQIIEETAQLDFLDDTRFHATNAPAVSIQDYLRRIAKYAHCSNSVFIVSLIYLDRLQERKELVLNRHSIHRQPRSQTRLLITAVMLAAKVHDDSYYKNQYYARVGGISATELNLLERDFIDMIAYDFFVAPALFWAYHNRVASYLVALA